MAGVKRRSGPIRYARAESLSALVDRETAEVFRVEAEARGIRTCVLMRHLAVAIAQGDLFDQILGVAKASAADAMALPGMSPKK
jgi:hypothetical protein